jgi:hypothetical protein
LKHAPIGGKNLKSVTLNPMKGVYLHKEKYDLPVGVKGNTRWKVRDCSQEEKSSWEGQYRHRTKKYVYVSRPDPDPHSICLMGSDPYYGGKSFF